MNPTKLANIAMTWGRKVGWSVVRIFGKVSYFNISYGVLFGVPILFELYANAVPVMRYLGAPGPFPVTLRWIYAASILFAIAIFFYQVFAPKEIKRFEYVDEYVKANLDIFQTAHTHQRLSIVLPHLDQSADGDAIGKINEFLTKIEQADGNDKLALERQLDEYLATLHKDAVNRYLIKNYELLNVSYPVARWVSFLAYIAGIAIVLILLILRSLPVLIPEKVTMIIFSKFVDTDLQLSAYSKQSVEFDALRDTLKAANVTINFSSLTPDSYGRSGEAYLVSGPEVDQLESTLQGKFEPNGRFRMSTQTLGAVYSCQELAVTGAGPRCENLSATSYPTAVTQCSLIAGSNNWFGGKANKGQCP